jgi:hypothetical protein
MAENYNMEIIRILNNNYHQSIRWSNRCKQSSFQTTLKEKIKRFLLALSGNDLVAMLDDVLETAEVKDLKYAKMHIETLRNMSVAVNKIELVKPKNKHNFIRPFRQAGFSLPQVKELGFKCSKNLWKSCTNTYNRHLGGRAQLPEIIIQEINTHMDNLSNIGANRSIVARQYAQRNPFIIFKKTKLSQQLVNVRYRQTSIKDAYRLFKASPRNNLNEVIRNKIRNFRLPTFRKYLDKRYKKPFRFTDLCSYCENGKEFVKEIKKITNLDFTFDTNFNLDIIRNHLRGIANGDAENAEKVRIALEKTDLLESIQWHMQLAERQRKSYVRDRVDIQSMTDRIVIEIDFKSAITLGDKGPRQLNEEFFQGNKPKAICLGFGIYHLATKGRFKYVKCLNIDMISDSPGTSAKDVIFFFRHLMTQDFFQNIDQPNYTIWADCGPQLRCAEMNHFFFTELANLGKCVNLNFFGEKHG